VQSAVTIGDALGFVVFRGSDGTNFVNAGYIKGTIDAAVSTGVVPGRLEFHTNTDTGADTEYMRISSSGVVSVLGTTASTSTTTGTLLSAGGLGVVGAIFGATLNATTTVAMGAVIFTALGTPANGTLSYCSDCDPPTLVESTCTHAGAQTGSLAMRVNGAWKCLG
jgi:hypothetical protein